MISRLSSITLFKQILVVKIYSFYLYYYFFFCLFVFPFFPHLFILFQCEENLRNLCCAKCEDKNSSEYIFLVTIKKKTVWKKKRKRKEWERESKKCNKSTTFWKWLSEIKQKHWTKVTKWEKKAANTQNLQQPILFWYGSLKYIQNH